VLYELPVASRDRLLTMPTGAAVLLAAWRLLWRPLFARRQRRTFRYANCG